MEYPGVERPTQGYYKTRSAFIFTGDVMRPVPVKIWLGERERVEFTIDGLNGSWN
jgi:hypothetical protein